jgi:hypothetical protein
MTKDMLFEVPILQFPEKSIPAAFFKKKKNGSQHF